MSQEDLESQHSDDQEAQDQRRRVLTVGSVAEISLAEAHVDLQSISAPSVLIIFSQYWPLEIIQSSQGLYHEIFLTHSAI